MKDKSVPNLVISVHDLMKYNKPDYSTNWLRVGLAHREIFINEKLFQSFFMESISMEIGKKNETYLYHDVASKMITIVVYTSGFQPF